MSNIKVGDYVIVKPDRTFVRDFDQKLCRVVTVYPSQNVTLTPVKDATGVKLLFDLSELVYLGSSRLIDALYGV